MNESKLRKIAYNCHKATFLIEKKQIGTITLKEKIELQIHLASCSICQTFMKQSLVINQMVRNIIYTRQSTQSTLEEPFKKQLQDRIEERLNR